MMAWFEKYGDEHERRLCKKLLSYPIREEQLILVHYDFQPDNLFYDGKHIHVIDFNDMMMHLPELDLLCCFKDIDEAFHPMVLKGYESSSKVKLTFEHKEFLNEFDLLFSRYRMKRAMSESWINEPSWMIALRKKFEDKLKAPV
ncbi:MAG: phosphotransferase [Clostridia bacterium]|nr:phosphotransferase [Clostridia bacterium]